MKLEVKDLHKSFAGKEVLKGVSFSINSGSALGLLGRNGAGKTTTIRIIMDIFRGDSGEILLDGKKFDPGKNQVGYLPEERGMYPKKTVIEQMVYFAKLRGMDKKSATESAKKWLKKLQIEEYEKRKMDTLSKGNQQKVQLAATLICSPDIVVLDEPFSGLDPVNSQILKDVISEQIEEGKLVIFSSHQMSYVEEFCEDIAIVNHGEIVLAGNLDEIKTKCGEGLKVLSAVNYSLEELKQLCQSKLASCAEVQGDNKREVILKLKTEEWAFLEACKETGIQLRSFGAYEPSLNDIFVSVAGDEEGSVN